MKTELKTPLPQVGASVRSGSEVLQCTGRGVWLRKGEIQP
jgi:Zn-finger nucleic acid-binding protein